MCFSNHEPGDAGPRRIHPHEIRDAFSAGWTVESITAERFGTNPEASDRDFSDGGPKAWLAIIRREE
jgi:hypothetical protein